MKLFEYEGKELFAGAGIAVPEGVVVESIAELERIKFVDPGIRRGRDTIPGSGELEFPLVVKAQVLSGKRGKRGLVKKVSDRQVLEREVEGMLGREVDGEKIEKVLVVEAVEIERELFVSVTYSTKSRGPVCLFSVGGGVEVEEGLSVSEMPISISNDEFLISKQIPNFNEQISKQLDEVVNKLWRLFRDRDLFLAEINPLAVTKEGKLVALDAKVVTDDAANFRQKWELPERNMLGKAKSWAELETEKIDAEDHRGVVGRVYLDLPGDIGVIAAGGGASLVAMDAMMGFGLAPANYTEFSGNPPAWKVKRLSEIVMAKENLRGVMLVGGKANFTDQMETLSGFAEVLREKKPRYPIVVRRDGPRMSEAKQMLIDLASELGLRLEVYDEATPIVEAIGKLNEMVGGADAG